MHTYGYISSMNIYSQEHLYVQIQCVNMHKCIYVYIRTLICTFICIHTYVQICTYKCVCACVFVCVCVCVLVFVCVHEYVWSLSLAHRRDLCVCIYPHTQSSTSTHIYKHKCIPQLQHLQSLSIHLLAAPGRWWL